MVAHYPCSAQVGTGGGVTSPRRTHTLASDSSINWAVNDFDHVGKKLVRTVRVLTCRSDSIKLGLCLSSQRDLCLSPMPSPYHVHLHSLEPQGQALTWRPFKAISNAHGVVLHPSCLRSRHRHLVQGVPEHAALHRDEEISKLNFLQACLVLDFL